MLFQEYAEKVLLIKAVIERNQDEQGLTNDEKWKDLELMLKDFYGLPYLTAVFDTIENMALRRRTGMGDKSVQEAIETEKELNGPR